MEGIPGTERPVEQTADPPSCMHSFSPSAKCQSPLGTGFGFCNTQLQPSTRKPTEEKETEINKQ